jgi:hypothetical protein
MYRNYWPLEYLSSSHGRLCTTELVALNMHSQDPTTRWMLAVALTGCVLCPQVRRLHRTGTVQCANTTTPRNQTFCMPTLMQVTDTRTVSVTQTVTYVSNKEGGVGYPTLTPRYCNLWNEATERSPMDLSVPPFSCHASPVTVLPCLPLQSP